MAFRIDQNDAVTSTVRRSFFVISGCSGSGKSSLLDALAARGYNTVTEPGRRIIESECAPDSPRLPWNDMAGFSRAALSMADADVMQAADCAGPVFFDRGVVDAAVALAHSTGRRVEPMLAARPRYARIVFLVPPWPEIRSQDAVRRHGFRAARAEYRRLTLAYDQLGYRTRIVPRTTINARAAFVLQTLGLAPSRRTD